MFKHKIIVSTTLIYQTNCATDREKGDTMDLTTSKPSTIFPNKTKKS